MLHVLDLCTQPMQSEIPHITRLRITIRQHKHGVGQFYPAKKPYETGVAPIKLNEWASTRRSTNSIGFRKISQKRLKIVRKHAVSEEL